jgi:hypothetical protein
VLYWFIKSVFVIVLYLVQSKTAIVRKTLILIDLYDATIATTSEHTYQRLRQYILAYCVRQRLWSLLRRHELGFCRTRLQNLKFNLCYMGRR